MTPTNRPNGCDLRLMSSVNDVNSIPTEGKNLIIVANVQDVLHFGVFAADGKRVVDTDESQLPDKATQIAKLKSLLSDLWGVPELPQGDKERIISAVTSIVGHTPSEPSSTGGDSPYVGMRSYDIDDGPLFFGREREIRELGNLLVAERILLLHSPSGAGKTSLSSHKLIPYLRDREFDVLPVIRVGLPPGRENESGTTLETNRYVHSTLASLEMDPTEDSKAPAQHSANLASMETALRRRADTYRRRTGIREVDTLLIFDQFEEILTADPTDTKFKEEFFAELGDVLSQRQRWAVFAIQEDYVAALSPYADAIPTRLKITYRLDLLDERAALLAIRKPAEFCGVTFEKYAADKLIDDLRQVQLQAYGTRRRRRGQENGTARRADEVAIGVPTVVGESRPRIPEDHAGWDVEKLDRVDQDCWRRTWRSTMPSRSRRSPVATKSSSGKSASGLNAS